jgi:ribonuclease D
MIHTTEELLQTANLLRAHERIALDTEADSLHCYFDKLCLLQITVPGHNLLIDPLADLSLEPSADYDLRLMRRLGYPGPTRLFDTMIAARLCGALEFGLAALLHSHFGIVLAKASQKANWALRPLPKEMLEYAVNDTAHLLTLAQIQEARLRELGRWDWFEQSCEKAIRSASVQREKDPETLWRISGYADLTPRGTAILRALWTWRDQEAQAVDRPSFHILTNELLLEFSRRFDQGHPVDPRHLRGARRDRFFAAAQSARELDESQWPKILRKPRLRTTPQQDALFKELRKIRDDAAHQLHLDPTLIAPKATLEQLSRNESVALENLMPWQKGLLKLS